MSLALTETEMARKKATSKPAVGPAKLELDVLKKARAVVGLTGEGLSEYLSRLLAPLVEKDFDEAYKGAKSKK